jgi:phosphatidate cytidylyltransferase
MLDILDPRILNGFCVAFTAGGVGTIGYAVKKGGRDAIKISGKFFVFLLIAVVILSASQYQAVISAIALVIGVLGLQEMINSPANIYKKKALGLYCGLAVLFVLSCYLADPGDISVVYLIALGSDGFAQLSGQLFGRHRIFPRISPQKTWEGFIGGFIITMSGLLYIRLSVISPEKVLLYSILIISCFVGDALASMYKRKAGLKDFGRTIPFHGGVLDRFDSLITAASVYLVFLSLGITV